MTLLKVASASEVWLLQVGTNWEQIPPLYISSITTKWNWQGKLVLIIEENAMTTRILKWLIYDPSDHKKLEVLSNLCNKNKEKLNPRMHCRLIIKLLTDIDYP